MPNSPRKVHRTASETDELNLDTDELTMAGIRHLSPDQAEAHGVEVLPPLWSQVALQSLAAHPAITNPGELYQRKFPRWQGSACLPLGGCAVIFLFNMNKN